MEHPAAKLIKSLSSHQNKNTSSGLGSGGGKFTQKESGEFSSAEKKIGKDWVKFDENIVKHEDGVDFVNCFFRDVGLMRSHVASYDQFLTTYISGYLNNYNFLHSSVTKDDDSHHVSMSLVCIQTRIGSATSMKSGQDIPSKFKILQECRNSNSTYCIPIFVTVKCTIETKDAITKIANPKKTVEKIEELLLGYIPLMLGSSFCITKTEYCNDIVATGECGRDVGGYFIVGGGEKVIISQEKLATNRMYAFSNKDGIVKTEIRSNCLETKKNVFFSMSYVYPPRKVVKCIHFSSSAIFAKFDIKILPLFYIFDIFDRETIVDLVVGSDLHLKQTISDELQGSFEDSFDINSLELAKKYLASKRIVATSIAKRTSTDQFIDDFLAHDFLPHARNKLSKIYCLSKMIRKLLDVAANRRDCDERDSFENKRVDMAGNLLFIIFKQSMNKIVKSVNYEATKFLSKYLDLKPLDITPAECASKIHLTTIFNLTTKDLIQTFNYSLSTGNWGNSSSEAYKTGVAQVLSRINYLSTLSHLRRVTAPVGKNSTSSGPRHLHNTQFGYCCAHQTPEGDMAGFIKHLSIGCHVSLRRNLDYYESFLTHCGMRSLSELYTDKEERGEFIKQKELDIARRNNTESEEKLSEGELKKLGNNIGVAKDVGMFCYSLLDQKNFVILNGECKGFFNGSLRQFFLKVKSHKRGGILPFDVSVYFKNNEIHIGSDEGRCCRPLFIVKDSKVRVNREDLSKMCKGDVKWEDLLKNEVIEYQDTNEQQNDLVSVSIKNLMSQYRTEKEGKYSEPDTKSLGYNESEDLEEVVTHCEIHSNFVMGTSVASIPFSEHNPSPRICYSSSMVTQGMGIPFQNAQNRFDTVAYQLVYPQKPLVTTIMSENIGVDEMLSGVNVVIAIGCYGGWNQEDSCIVNRSAVDRGLFRSLTTKTHVSFENKTNMYDESFCKTHGKLDEDGTLPLGSFVEEENVIMGKTCSMIGSSSATSIANEKKTSNVKIKMSEQGFVDSVLFSVNDKQQKMVKMKIRSIKIPEVGDKLSSRYAQKHTLGILMDQEDMPFNSEGMSPDIIINPHAIISRMTMGQIIEGIVGKTSCFSGKIGNGTAFDHPSLEEMVEDMKKNGIHDLGDEQYTNGITGLPMKLKMFTGVSYYSRLKHLVSDKIHTRVHGPTQMLTRQPTEGRSRGGGLRLGEMERDCMIGHGGSAFLRERLFKTSDAYSMDVCKTCGMFVERNFETGNVYCNICGNSNNFSKVEMAYSSKLLFQELNALTIKVRITPKNSNVDMTI